MAQMLIITVKYALIVGSFRKAFADITTSTFHIANVSHGLSGGSLATNHIDGSRPQASYTGNLKSAFPYSDIVSIRKEYKNETSLELTVSLVEIRERMCPRIDPYGRQIFKFDDVDCI